MREPLEEPISRGDRRRQVYRWVRVHRLYLLPNGHRWRMRTAYRRRIEQHEPPVEIRYFCALHPHIQLVELQSPVDYNLPGVIRAPHPERPGRWLTLFCPECCGAGYTRLQFPVPSPDHPL